MIALIYSMFVAGGVYACILGLVFVSHLPAREFFRKFMLPFPDRHLSISAFGGVVCRFTYQTIRVKISLSQGKGVRDISIRFETDRFPFRATAHEQKGTMRQVMSTHIGTLGQHVISIPELAHKGVMVLTNDADRATRYFASAEKQQCVTQLIEHGWEIALSPKGVVLSMREHSSHDLHGHDFEKLLRDGSLLTLRDPKKQTQTIDYDGLIRSVVCLLAIDNQISPDEIQFLDVLGKRYGLHHAVIEEALAQAKTGTVSVYLPKDRAGRKRLFDLLVQAAMADGTMAPQEQKVLDAVASKMTTVKTT